MNNKRKITISLITTGFVLIVLLAAAYYVKFQQGITNSHASGVVLQVLSTKTSVKVGDEFIVSVYIDTGGLSVTGADVRVRYDSSRLLAETITPGTFLPVVFVPGKITQASAIAQIILGSNPTAPKAGNGILETVKFKAIAASTATNIFLGPATAIAAVGYPTSVLSGAMPSVNVAITKAP